MRLDIRTLGPLEVLLDGQRIDVGTRKQRALMALLVINRGRAVSAERIVMALWGPDAPPHRRRDVWVYVSRLRKALEAAGEPISRLNGGYLLDVADEAVDASRFEALVEEGRRLLEPDPPAASLVLDEALAIWSGGAYAEFATDDFAAPEVVRLEEARVAAIELRIEADLAWMGADGLIPELESMVRLHPLRAGFTASLMMALYRQGRQAEALRAYRALADLLVENAGLEPPEDLRLLEERILMDDPALQPVNPRLAARMPERIVSFVGRDADLDQVVDLLGRHRLVVITGPGGVGKTTLATEVARRLALQHDDAVLVDVTKAEVSKSVAPAVADALRVNAAGSGLLDAIVARLGSRRVLLVVDNCEGLAEQAGNVLAELLQGAPGLRVLATSRVVLGIPGEQIVRLPPFGIDSDGDALHLLRDRIAALPGSVADVVTDVQMRAIVARTAGLPLAIELAAAQLSTWSPAEVIEALDDPLGALVLPDRMGPERHRELRASIAWSERLLSPQAAELLARLSVFSSSFAFEAVGPVAGFGRLADGGGKDELRRLVDSSLVLVEPGPRARYRLLEPVRDYARLRLADAGETDVAAERHAQYYLDRLEQVGPKLQYSGGADLVRQIAPDSGNLLAALAWAIEAGDAGAAQRGAAQAVPLWRMVTGVTEALRVIEAALEVSEAPTRARAELIFMAAPFWWVERGIDAWLERLAELQELAATLDDPEVSAWAVLRQADSEMSQGAEPDTVIDLYRRAMEAFRSVESPHITKAFHQLGWYLYWLWDRWPEAEAVAAEWMALARASGWAYEETIAREFGCWLALAAGDTKRLEAEAAAVASAYRRQGDHRRAAGQMSTLAMSSLQRGDPAEALRRVDVAVAATEEEGIRPWIWTALMTRACVKVALDDHRGGAVDLLRIVSAAEESDQPGLQAVLASVASRVAAAAEPDTAAVILGASEEVLQADGLYQSPRRLVLPALDALIGEPGTKLREVLGHDEYTAARASGAALAVPDAEALVEETLHRIAADT